MDFHGGTTARRLLLLALFGVVSAGLVTGAYRMLERFLRDRQSAMNHNDRRTAALRQRVRDARTSPEGQNPARPGNLPPQSATASGEAAIQRQLRTLEEINRINEMNRRLQEQQQRMNQQR